MGRSSGLHYNAISRVPKRLEYGAASAAFGGTNMVQCRRSIYIPAIICLVVVAFISITVVSIEYQKRSNGQNANRNVLEYSSEQERITSQLLLGNIKGDNILQNLRQLSKKPHRAGTEENYRVAQWIRDQWKGQGLQDVHFAEYDVLLSHPADYDRPNTVELLDKNGRVIFQSIGQSPPLVPQEQSDHGANLTFNAYSASGTAIGELVYVNYASKGDFDFLEKANITLKGKIAIARYGMEWRGAKASQVQLRGAIGLIIYSDPAEACSNRTDDGATYPHSMWMPKGGVQLGSLMNFNGDPLTPLYPAVDYMYRSKNMTDLLDEAIIPSIPVQPISYADAYQFLSRMKGKVAPDGWQGGLNVTYRIGTGSDWKVRLTVRANTTREKIRNVIGFIEGNTEPDRYVIVGNHFDAWIYGAIDPNSGTATMLEMSRAFMKVINETGWRPRRTIVFCAWDGEEHSVIGSTEWIEQYTTLLDRRGVAYLNVDLISGNETLDVTGSPTLYRTAVTAAKRVLNPDPEEQAAGRTTVFDTWLRKSPPKLLPDLPDIPPPDGGSDDVSFSAYLGLPVLDITYKNLSKSGSYPLYHTLYETIFVEEKILDPNHFAFHVATGQFWAEAARILADSDHLPLDSHDYATVIKAYVEELNKTLIKIGLVPKMEELTKDMDSLGKAVERMSNTAAEFHDQADHVPEDEPATALYEPSSGMTKSGSYQPRHLNEPISSPSSEMINSRLQQLERCFINPRGVDQSIQRHVIYGTDGVDAYAANYLPFIYRKVAKYQAAKDEKGKKLAYNELRAQISILHYSVECAISLLKKTPK